MSADPATAALELELQRLTAGALSPLARYGHVALLLAATLMSVLLAALLATEPALPGRTQAALAVLLAIGISWIVYATWVLRQRRPLLGQHRIVAGRMAVAFTGVFFAGALALGASTGSATYHAAASVGASLLVLAFGALMQAHWRVAALQRQRRELLRQTGSAA